MNKELIHIIMAPAALEAINTRLKMQKWKRQNKGIMADHYLRNCSLASSSAARKNVTISMMCCEQYTQRL